MGLIYTVCIICVIELTVGLSRQQEEWSIRRPKSIMLAGPKPAGDLCASWSQTCVIVDRSRRVARPKSTMLASPKTCSCVA